MTIWGSHRLGAGDDYGKSSGSNCTGPNRPTETQNTSSIPEHLVDPAWDSINNAWTS